MADKIWNAKSAFDDWFKANATDYTSHQHVADFMKVRKAVISEWGRGKHWPIGYGLIRLSFLLEAMGYNLIELTEVDPLVKSVNRIIISECLPVQDIFDLCERQHHHITQTLTSKRAITDHLREKFTMICEIAPEAPNVLNEKLKTTLEKLATRAVERAEVKAVETQVEAAAEAEAELVSKGASPMLSAFNGTLKTQPIRLLREVQADPPIATNCIEGWTAPSAAYKKLQIEQLAIQIKIMLPIAHFVDSDKCSKGDREMLRELAGDGAVFKLSNLLHKLCSEASRRHFNAQ